MAARDPRETSHSGYIGEASLESVADTRAWDSLNTDWLHETSQCISGAYVVTRVSIRVSGCDVEAFSVRSQASERG